MSTNDICDIESSIFGYMLSTSIGSAILFKASKDFKIVSGASLGQFVSLSAAIWGGNSHSRPWSIESESYLIHIVPLTLNSHQLFSCVISAPTKTPEAVSNRLYSSKLRNSSGSFLLAWLIGWQFIHRSIEPFTTFLHTASVASEQGVSTSTFADTVGGALLNELLDEHHELRDAIFCFEEEVLKRLLASEGVKFLNELKSCPIPWKACLRDSVVRRTFISIDESLNWNREINSLLDAVMIHENSELISHLNSIILQDRKSCLSSSIDQHMILVHQLAPDLIVFLDLPESYVQDRNPASSSSVNVIEEILVDDKAAIVMQKFDFEESLTCERSKEVQNLLSALGSNLA